MRINKNSHFLLTCLFTLLSIYTLKAQFNCKVEGVVTQNGKKLSGAIVSLSSGSGSISEVTTGANGTFSFTLEPNEEYTVWITKPGYIKSQIVFSTMGFTDEEAQTFKNVSKPEISLFELPQNEQVLAKVNDVLATPLKSYYYSAEKKSLITDEVLDLTMQKEFAKIQKIAEAAPKEVVKDESNINYQNAISKADKSLAEKEYVIAKKTYEEALTYRPSESYPKTKLNEINKSIAAQDKALTDAAKEKERLEKEALAKTDADKKLADAKEKQRLEQEAVAKATEEKRLAEEKQATEQKALAYAKEKERLEKEALAKAEEDKKFIEAKEKQRLEQKAIDKALEEKRLAEEKQATEQKALADAREKERMEKEVLAKAEEDKKFVEAKEKQRLEQEAIAKAAEEKRLTEEKQAAEQKALVDAKEKERIEKEELAKAEENKKLEEAKEKQRLEQKAIAKAAEEKRLAEEKGIADAKEKQRLEQEKLIVEAAEKKKRAEEAELSLLENNYKAAITTADSAFQAKNYSLSKTAFNAALTLKPGELYPKGRIVEADALIAASYTNELARKYPQGVTEEVSKENNAKVTKRIVVDGNKGSLYIKKETGFGATYYFKDGISITEQEFKRYTESK